MRLRTCIVVATLTALSGCASQSGPCNYSGRSAPCSASIEVINGILVLVGPACSKTLISSGSGQRRRVDNDTGQQPVGKSNEELSLVPGSCRVYPTT